MKPGIKGLVLLVSLFMVGCTLKPIYNNLYWLVPWYIEDYVTLRDGQSQRMRDGLRDFIEAHREEQIPHYIGFLRSLEPFADGVTEQQLWYLSHRVENFWDELKLMMAPEIEHFMLSLDEQQKKELFESLDESNQELRERLQEPGESAQERYRERTESLVDFWLGSPTEQQQRLLKAYQVRLKPNDQGWIDSRERWQQALREALVEPVEVDRLRFLLTRNRELWSLSYRESILYHRELTVQLISQLSYTLTERQKKRFKEQLQGIIESLESL
ncbi:DUF6279 family lipoprotein [Aestuariirhabdus sp. Z084]|uniref:DUF6279 family lipoprotein n=1 Tax=Aestuariirhabdus haliotis TaxID=2918751 RepID=UPI00201B3FEF|nr:DUF6279 family lipoprotein [Aestuariirhabdus haliotis]MCL6415182.1 DUF6279 family lipoprotein [Aestuariirhabdus haliotis]MCL6420057.1 DUF6279 family lipoprotein [Aestuariirhabdus haliotis]